MNAAPMDCIDGAHALRLSLSITRPARHVPAATGTGRTEGRECVDRPADDGVLAARTADAEACLLGRIAAGDRKAFEALYRAYFPRLERFLRRMTRSAPLIEEIVNDTMLAVWRKAATFDGSSKASTWIFAIAYRRACKSLQSFDEPVEALDDEREGHEADRPDLQLECQRLGQAVDAALATLPLAQRTVFQLTLYHDMSYLEIAEIMACPINTIKTRLFHARKRLATLLAGQMEQGS
jgi:RNA polymerase sigma-70 factor (ECF subfamily)